MLVSSLSCQVLYMKTVVGTQQLDNVITIQPLSMTQVGEEGRGGVVEVGGRQGGVREEWRKGKVWEGSEGRGWAWRGN